MSEEKKTRLETLAELFDKIPPEKQEGIELGITMLAAVYESDKKTA